MRHRVWGAAGIRAAGAGGDFAEAEHVLDAVFHQTADFALVGKQLYSISHLGKVEAAALLLRLLLRLLLLLLAPYHRQCHVMCKNSG